MTREVVTLCLVVLCGMPSATLAEGPQNPYVTAVRRLYENLEYEEALRTLAAAETSQGRTLADDVWIALFEGIIHAELGHADQALGSFKRGLALNPNAKLPVDVSPKVHEVYEQAIRELRVWVPPVTSSPPTPSAAPNPTINPSAASAPPPGPLETNAAAVEVMRSPAIPPSPNGWHLRVGVTGWGDMAEKALAWSPGLGIRWNNIEIGGEAVIGTNTGIGVKAAYLLGNETVRLGLGGRGGFFPGAGNAIGGGPMVGVRVELGAGFDAMADTSVLFFSDSVPYRSLAWVACVGVGYEFLAF